MLRRTPGQARQAGGEPCRRGGPQRRDCSCRCRGLENGRCSLVELCQENVIQEPLDRVVGEWLTDLALRQSIPLASRYSKMTLKQKSIHWSARWIRTLLWYSISYVLAFRDLVPGIERGYRSTLIEADHRLCMLPCIWNWKATLGCMSVEPGKYRM